MIVIVTYIDNNNEIGIATITETKLCFDKNDNILQARKLILSESMEMENK